MDATQWLQGLGLVEYAVLFREQAIDLDVLTSLTDADLEKLGQLASWVRGAALHAAQASPSSCARSTATAGFVSARSRGSFSQ
jgi:hypothetical protein